MTEGSGSPGAPPADRIERIPLGLRWINDAFHEAPVASGFAMRLVDMTRAKAGLRTMRDARIPATMAHIIVRACALVLARNPQWHRLYCDYRVLTPQSVDIGLSVAGETTYAPVVVLAGADKKTLTELVPFTIAAIDAAGEKEKVDLASMRRQMWVIPFGFIRRFILRLLNKSLWFRRRLVGTFQVSILPTCDIFAPFLFYTGSLLAASAIRDRVIAVDGQPAVRQTMWLSLCAEHSAMDGVRTVELLEAIKEMLESEELLAEAQSASEARRAAKAALQTAPAAERERAPAPTA